MEKKVKTVLAYLYDSQDNEVLDRSKTFMYDKFGFDNMEDLIEDGLVISDDDSFRITGAGMDKMDLLVSNIIEAENAKAEADDDDKWVASSLLFSRALGLILEENEGVVVELKNDLLDSGVIEKTKHNKVIVYSKGDDICVIECGEDLPDGQLVWVSENESDSGINLRTDLDE